jgi:hypothetical protein|tara:strand:- start:767 stop:976 length:210 start_codon:yes stop_codon:yes gene_type:complete
MKLKPYLPEDVFILEDENLPKEHHTDRFGKVMVFRKDVGWSVIVLKDVYTYFKHMKHTHWTYTPDTPHD